MTTFTETPSQKNVHILFTISMWWRVFYGALRIVLGTALLHNIGQSLSAFVYSIMSHELTGKTGDAILEHFYNLFESHEFTVTYFIATYFIFWGAIDIILSLSLLRHIRIAFPISIALIGLFICYSIFRYTFTHSLVILSVIVIDVVILLLIYSEYRRLYRTT
jgi:uncharacterized membrane protein